MKKDDIVSVYFSHYLNKEPIELSSLQILHDRITVSELIRYAIFNAENELHSVNFKEPHKIELKFGHDYKLKEIHFFTLLF